MELIDAQARHAATPTTFEVPSEADLAAIFVEDYVKIALTAPNIGAERFWVEVTSLENGAYRGKVSNDLVRFGNHYSYGDEITFEAKHVMDIISTGAAAA
ncbi:hypothetical protein HGG70_05185 [Rhodobacteraceae bacterium R_SAG4]|nr:hypothetical protein [Rhodobacteraceae bacterium R_SAG4]